MTIYWTYTSIQSIFDLFPAGELRDLLGKDEQAYLDHLRFEKRRREWLAGRLALKALLIESFQNLASKRFNQLQILKEEGGAPRLALDEGETPIPISLSHSNGSIFCACSTGQSPIGVDLELIEERSQAFISDYFTPEEISQVERHTPQKRSLYSTLVWSAKEAVLKALSIGLKMDTRRINVNPESTSFEAGWKIPCSPVLIRQKESLRLLWRREGSFVLTVCFDGALSVDFRRILI